MYTSQTSNTLDCIPPPARTKPLSSAGSVRESSFYLSPFSIYPLYDLPKTVSNDVEDSLLSPKINPDSADRWILLRFKRTDNLAGSDRKPLLSHINLHNIRFR